ncbi:antitoxin MazE family protein [Alicycliphilus denitrificans]|uniref:antitoxin MazE family protein n=1 Tax=Alicycliphilus denitrificans TaxID=179636 RepID=UPI0001DA02DE|nr:antitoxin MazE family protein [Alicycliphilus denitrificans]ADV02228.1 hypothetical protein Alide_4628 [Alicycliphilus denitrificans BC]
MATSASSIDKVARYRERMRASGLRLVQFWVPDTRSAEFMARVREQCQRLAEDPQEEQALRFTQSAAELIEGWE